jgi:hypothetical protein
LIDPAFRAFVGALLDLSGMTLSFGSSSLQQLCDRDAVQSDSRMQGRPLHIVVGTGIGAVVNQYSTHVCAVGGGSYA